MHDDPLLILPRRTRRRSRTRSRSNIDEEDTVSSAQTQSCSRSHNSFRSNFQGNVVTDRGNSYVHYTLESLSKRSIKAEARASPVDTKTAQSEFRDSSQNVDSTELGQSAIQLSTMDSRSLGELANKRCRLQFNFELTLRKRRTALREITNYWFHAVKTEDLCKVEKGSNETYRQYIKSASILIHDQISRQLMKYLKMIGQEQKHNRETVCKQIELYLMCNMSAEAFLQQYFQFQPEIIGLPNLIRNTDDTAQSFNAKREMKPCTERSRGRAARISSLQTWKIHLDSQSINHRIKHGLRFRLTRAEVTLICSVYSIPVCQLQPFGRTNRFTIHHVQPKSGDFPASTIETSITNSEPLSCVQN